MKFLITPRVAMATGLTLAVATAQAALPWSLAHVSLGELKQAIHLNDAQSAVLSTSSRNSLQWVSQHTDEQGRKHVRLQQYYAGFPVWGGYAIIHSPPDGLGASLQRLNGLIYRAIDQELGEAPLHFVKGGKAALDHVKAGYSTGTLSEETVTPLVYLDEQHKPHWAYRVSVLIEHTNGMPKRPTAIVDAYTFAPFMAWDDIKTIKKEVQGQGFGGNTHTEQVHYGKGTPFLRMMRDAFMGLCTLENQHVSVWNMESRINGQGQLFSFGCKASADAYWTGPNQDGYDHVNGAYSPSNDALYIGTLVHDMYAYWYGVNALGSPQRPMKLVMRVHYGQGFENAFWDGKKMTFGDGGEEMYPLVAMSVGAHEVSHGFTEQYSDLVYVGQSGGMNEAFSDMAAQAIEYYAKATNSWTIGAEVMKEKSGHSALRFMDKPAQDGKSIDSADQYRKGLDVHYSSGVYNRFFYLLANQPGWNTRQAFHIMIKANMDYWTPQSTFSDGACGVLSAANDLGLSLDGVKQSFKAVAIDTEGC